MLYKNDDKEAIFAMELARTGYYGEFGSYGMQDDSVCPCCGAENPSGFYMNDDDECVGCAACVRMSEALY